MFYFDAFMQTEPQRGEARGRGRSRPRCQTQLCPAHVSGFSAMLLGVLEGDKQALFNFYVAVNIFQSLIYRKHPSLSPALPFPRYSEVI